MLVCHYTVVLAHSLMMQRNFTTNKDVGLQRIHVCSVGKGQEKWGLSPTCGSPTNENGVSPLSDQDMGWSNAIAMRWSKIMSNFLATFPGKLKPLDAMGSSVFEETIFWTVKQSPVGLHYIRIPLFGVPCRNQAPIIGQSPVCKGSSMYIFSYET